MIYAAPSTDRVQIRLSFVAPSGSGKSSAVNCLAERLQAIGLTVAVLKLADPLYRLQSIYYDVVGQHLDVDSQDQILMETIATQLRRIDPEVLANDFQRRLTACAADVVLNDDLRDDQIDAVRLRALGFKVVRVATSESVRLARLNSRNDPSIVTDSPLDRQVSRIPADFVIPNSAPGLEALDRQIAALSRHIIASNQPLGAIR
ncbi:MAG: dephospho-CoA kinase [Rhodobacteraceae bacterium]|nr:dephospho-CoA kinase [Paracoccaceae bacterium]